jgi:hypothetical protein
MACFVALLLAMTEERAQLPRLVIPADAGIQYAAPIRSIANAAEYWIIRFRR